MNPWMPAGIAARAAHLIAGAALLVGLLPAPALAAPANVGGMTYDESQRQISVSLAGTVSVRTQRIKNPDRLVIDLNEARLPLGQTIPIIQPRSSRIRSIRMGQNSYVPPVVRVVVDLVPGFEPMVKINQTSGKLMITLANPAPPQGERDLESLPGFPSQAGDPTRIDPPFVPPADAPIPGTVTRMPAPLALPVPSPVPPRAAPTPPPVPRATAPKPTQATPRPVWTPPPVPGWVPRPTPTPTPGEPHSGPPVSGVPVSGTPVSGAPISGSPVIGSPGAASPVPTSVAPKPSPSPPPDPFRPWSPPAMASPTPGPTSPPAGGKPTSDKPASGLPAAAQSATGKSPSEQAPAETDGSEAVESVLPLDRRPTASMGSSFQLRWQQIETLEDYGGPAPSFAYPAGINGFDFEHWFMPYVGAGLDARVLFYDLSVESVRQHRTDATLGSFVALRYPLGFLEPSLRAGYMGRSVTVESETTGTTVPFSPLQTYYGPSVTGRLKVAILPGLGLDLHGKLLPSTQGSLYPGFPSIYPLSGQGWGASLVTDVLHGYVSLGYNSERLASADGSFKQTFSGITLGIGMRY